MKILNKQKIIWIKLGLKYLHLSASLFEGTFQAKTTSQRLYLFSWNNAAFANYNISQEKRCKIVTNRWWPIFILPC